VAGYEDETGAQRLAAFVVPASPLADEDHFFAELRERIASRAGRNKLPSRFVLTDELPRGASGKVKKRVLLKDHLDVG
jgi:acyl-coenzyme A synthetase/AMP-(fatty) acid ligase